jgi:hypothetical protein
MILSGQFKKEGGGFFINEREQSMNRHLGTLICMITVLFLALPAIAFGYIDPGTGSYIIQILIATFLGGLLAIKIFWQKIKTFFVNIFKKKKEIE